MNTGSIFISHATADDPFVNELRRTLEGYGLRTWVDSRELVAGTALDPAISQAIADARQFIVVLSQETINSSRVRHEIKLALQQRKDDGYRIIPLLLEGVQPTALELWFDSKPLAIVVPPGPDGLATALPQLLAALGERLPDDPQPPQAVAAPPLEELILKLSDPTIESSNGTQRAGAVATLVYEPADSHATPVESRRFRFTAPLGPLEADDLRWYLEEYYRWPGGFFTEKVAHIEAQLPAWGQALYQAALAGSSAQAALTAWQQRAGGSERRFSVWVDSDLPDGSAAAAQAAAHAAASALLALPWELLHDGDGYLFQGRDAVRIRRRMPNHRARAQLPAGLPIRILLASPRPEDAHSSYLDHRSSAKPLVAALAELGDLVTLSVLNPPTLPALRDVLRQADAAGRPFHVLHFDGHGVYDRARGLGALCFEEPQDSTKLAQRRMALVGADELAAELRAYRIPLVFLDACQSAQTELDPSASVAARLLAQGVASVVAMSHSVLVETARRFVAAFYTRLAAGARVGAAMLAGQQALYGDRYRGRLIGKDDTGELRLHDWFVPVLYQEAQDPQLITALPGAQLRTLQDQRRQLRLGALPAEPPYGFQGRSRELLWLERLLVQQPYAVVRGQGGEGKTALATELARWLVASARFARAAFVSLETHGDARTALDALGHQLVPNYSVATYPNLARALQPVARALADAPTLIVFDNLESVLLGGTIDDGRQTTDDRRQTTDDGALRGLLDLWAGLRAAGGGTRLLFTSREALPAPFAQHTLTLGPLSRADALTLLTRVLAAAGQALADPNAPPQELIDLVEAAGCHARALVLLAPALAEQGTHATTSELRALMAALEQDHPGAREQSLFASVALSLRRLPAAMRAKLGGLGVFHGGAQLYVIGQVLEVETEEATNIAIALVEVGLASYVDYDYLRLDPALPAFLLRELDGEAQTAATARWAAAMRALLGFLYQQRSQDARLAASLTLLELPNLLALLAWSTTQEPPEDVVNLATRLEQLFAQLGRPQALDRATQARAAAASKLGAWSRAAFEAKFLEVERLIEQGDLRAAHAAAEELLRRCTAAGETAYPGAAYDLAMAYALLGRVLGLGGAAAAALPALAEAQRRFEALVAQGNSSAATMVAATLTDSGGCLGALGRLDEAAAAYAEGIEKSEQLQDARGVAVKKGQLASVRLLQRRYAEALQAYEEARASFVALGEPRSVATVWHQIGMVHKNAGQHAQAEQAYREALAIAVQQDNRAGEASSLSELGTLYDAMGRLEEAARFQRQAADLYTRLGDARYEGGARSNLADTLRKLGRYAEARREIERAQACLQPYGHAATPWKAWNILCNIETAAGNTAAAAAARGQAIAAYRAYRRDGGENQETGAQWCAVVGQTIVQGQTAELHQQLAAFADSGDTPASAKALIPVLQAILAGNRDPALADNEALDYDDAVEVGLLLEHLNGGAAAG